MPSTRTCRACGNLRHLSELEQRAPGRYYCPECPTPPPRLCLLCAEKATHANGLCHTHGERWRRWGKPPVGEWVAAFREERLNTCAVCGKRWNGYHGCRHCSAECLAAWKREAALAHWHARSPESKQAAIQRSQKLAGAKRARRKARKPCVICGTEFVGFPHEVLCGDPECKSKNVTRGTRAYRARQTVNEVAALAAELQQRMNCEQAAPDDHPAN
jgi:hypothetical protein